MIDAKKLDFYIQNDLNVLMVGAHGVGKTAMIKEAFERNNLRWNYFSAATMDPWVDFVGVPKEKVEDGNSFIELVRPKNFQNDAVEAIFMDELNRAKDKVRNAVMELIQFKSINGVPFKNLKVVWAAINPEDEDEEDMSYDVERLDPAQKDRFHIILPIPYKPHKPYFERKFGEAGVGAVEWWHELTEAQTKLVSPRRLEYAISLFQKGGDLRDVLTGNEFNLTKLRERLDNGSIIVKLRTLYENNDTEACQKAFSNINFTMDAIPYLLDDEAYIERFMSFVPEDEISKLLTDNDGVNINVIVQNAEADVIAPIVADIISTHGVKRPILQKLKDAAEERGLDTTSTNAFKNAVNEALKGVANERNERYQGMWSVTQQFNRSSEKEEYEKCVEFIAKIIYHTEEESLKQDITPYRQLSIKIMQDAKECLKEFDTTVDEVWQTIRDREFSSLDASDERMIKMEKYIKDFSK